MMNTGHCGSGIKSLSFLKTLINLFMCDCYVERRATLYQPLHSRRASDVVRLGRASGTIPGLSELVNEEPLEDELANS